MGSVFGIGVSLHDFQTNLAADIGILMFFCLGFSISPPITISSRCFGTIFGNVHILAETGLFINVIHLVDTFVSFQVFEETKSLTTFVAGVILLAVQIFMATQ